MKTVAIVGFSHLTDDRLQDSQADEIWTLNHAFVLGDRIPRIDRLFEIHRTDWALRKGEYRLTKYEEWLREPHDFPIYMHDHFQEFPASVKYPLEEVNRDIFAYLLRDGKPNLYYSSSFGYMFALAILEPDITDIEIHGVDMGNETEYGYQKPAGELMIGVAMGRRKTVHLHPSTALCKAQLYGYEGVPAASRERVETLLEIYRREHARFMQEQKDHAAKINAGVTRDASGYMESTAYGAMYAGAIQFLERQLNGDEYFFGRQHLETDRHKHFMEEEKWLAQTNQKFAAYQTARELDTDGRPGLVWNEYLDARSNMYAYSGARQTIQKLMDECDMRVVPDELRMEIRDDA